MPVEMVLMPEELSLLPILKQVYIFLTEVHLPNKVTLPMVITKVNMLDEFPLKAIITQKVHEVFTKVGPTRALPRDSPRSIRGPHPHRVGHRRALRRTQHRSSRRRSSSRAVIGRQARTTPGPLTC